MICQVPVAESYLLQKLLQMEIYDLKTARYGHQTSDYDHQMYSADIPQASTCPRHLGLKLSVCTDLMRKIIMVSRLSIVDCPVTL